MTLPRFNLANQVTILRFFIALAVFLLLQLIGNGAFSAEKARWVSFATALLFTLGTSLDAVDGYLARKHGMVTAFGRIADPFVDKIIVCGSMIFLAAMPVSREFLAPWMAVTIITREFLVTGIRGYMESVGVSFPAELPGKIKMIVQSVSIAVLIATLAIEGEIWPFLRVLNHALVWSTLVLTLWSAFNYVVKAAERLGPKEI